MEKMPNQPSIEKVQTAAVRIDGKIFTGQMHFMAFDKAKKEMPVDDFEVTEQGYLTNTGRFITREEAGRLADVAGQLDHLSEDDRESAAQRLDSRNIVIGTKILEEELES